MVTGNLTRNDIAEIHITSNLENAWYDNLYLHKEIFEPGTCFDAILNQDETEIDCGGVCDPCFVGPPIFSAPNPPERNPENVISIYSDRYADIIIDNFDFGKEFIVPELNRAIFQIPQVRYATIDNIKDNIKVNFNEIIQLNNFKIRR